MRARNRPNAGPPSVVACFAELQTGTKPLAKRSNLRHTLTSSVVCKLAETNQEDSSMGRGILLWLLGVPIPVIIILALLWH